jgi:hypothetical protein
MIPGKATMLKPEYSVRAIVLAGSFDPYSVGYLKSMGGFLEKK